MGSFRHEALLYAGGQEFLDATVPFISDAIARGEPILVVVEGRKLELLRDCLGDDADGVIFADMDEVGANPGRILPAWRDFVDAHSGPGRNLRGIGEPIGPDRKPAELAECQHHEALLNVAFEEADGFWLLCPYDTEALAPEIVEHARYTHPRLATAAARAESPAWAGPEQARFPFSEPLPPPAGEPRELRFEIHTLSQVRHFVARLAGQAGLTEPTISDLVLATNELATNSVCHGGGHGVLRIWREPDRVICEVGDAGVIDSPLAGRVRPDLGDPGGRGLWLANQVCDLVQVRSFGDGSVVRLHVRT